MDVAGSYVGGAAGGSGRPELGAAAWGDLRRSFGGLWPVWLGSSLVLPAMVAVSHLVLSAGGGLTLAGLLRGVEQYGAGAVFAAFAFLRLLAGEARVRPTAARWAAFLLLVGGCTPLIMLFAILAAGVVGALTADSETMMFAGSVASCVGFWVAGRLMLWPVAVLLGRDEVGPRASWRLMRGQVGRFQFQMVWWAGAPALASAALWFHYLDGGSYAALAGVAVLTSLAQAVTIAAQARLFRERVVEG